MSSNFERMMRIIDETFATRNDPGQIHVTKAQRKKLASIHPATMSQVANDDGPLIWVMVIPTIKTIMEAFIHGTISEKELLSQTKIGEDYDCIYLCSASTLPEARGQGATRKLCVKAIKEISEQHQIKALFVWPFSREGKLLAESIAKELKLPLLIRK